MRARLLAACSISLMLATAACNREDNNDCTDCIRLAYAQTQCSDPWGYGPDGSDVAVEYALRDFFTSTGVNIDEVSIVGPAEPIVTCSACGCPTGKTIYVTINSADTAAFTRVGFYR